MTLSTFSLCSAPVALPDVPVDDWPLIEPERPLSVVLVPLVVPLLEVPAVVPDIPLRALLLELPLIAGWPVISTLCPTCSERFEPPSSCHVVTFAIAPEAPVLPYCDVEPVADVPDVDVPLVPVALELPLIELEGFSIFAFVRM